MVASNQKTVCDEWATPDISVVIPAKNEESNICVLLDSLAAAAGPLSYEVILADNGSIDSTPEIAARNGAKVVKSSARTIAGVRNDGAKIAKGLIYAFLDADISVATDWFAQLQAVRPSVLNEDLATGARCWPVGNEGIFDRSWFRLLREKASDTYIGSAHFIISAENYAKVGGFDENLTSGEDVDICRRLAIIGVRVEPNDALHAKHHEFPRTFRQFFLREVWHGRGDKQAGHGFLSKIQALSILVWIALAVSAFTLALDKFFWSAGFLAVSAATASAISIFKFPRLTIRQRFENVFIIYVYLGARLCSLIFRLDPAGRRR